MSYDYIDLVKVIEADESYTDFEGLSSGEYVDDMMRNTYVERALRLYGDSDSVSEEALETLVAHWLYENIDQADNYLSVDETVDFIHTAAYILGSRHWMKYRRTE